MGLIGILHVLAEGVVERVVKDAHVECLSHGNLVVICLQGLCALLHVHTRCVNCSIERSIQSHHLVVLVN